MKYSTSRETTASPERVWTALTDVEAWPHWMTSYDHVQRLDRGPLGVGSTAQVSQPGLKDAVFRVTELIPGVEFTWATTTAGIRTTARHVVMPRVGGGTDVDLEVVQRGPLAPLVSRLLSRKIREFLATEAEGLCRAAENGTPPPPT